MSVLNEIIALMGNDLHFAIWMTVLILLVFFSRAAPISLAVPVTLIGTHVYYLFYGSSAYEVAKVLYHDLSAGAEWGTVLSNPDAVQLYTVAGIALLGYLGWCLGCYASGKAASAMFGRNKSQGADEG